MTTIVIPPKYNRLTLIDIFTKEVITTHEVVCDNRNHPDYLGYVSPFTLVDTKKNCERFLRDQWPKLSKGRVETVSE